MVLDSIEKRFVGETKGYGLFATSVIPAGSLVVKDEGRICTKAEYFLAAPEHREWSYQIDEEHVLMPVDFTHLGDEWYVNHSCDPNTILRENGTWYARRDIMPGEEITADYGLFWTNDFENFEIDPCECGSVHCRGRMTGNDWMIPEFQKKYENEMPVYIQKKVQLLRITQSVQESA